MDPDAREPRRPEAGQGRALTGEKSPAGSVKRARQRAAAGLQLHEEAPQLPQYPVPVATRSPRRSPQHEISPTDRIRYPQYPISGSNSPGTGAAGTIRPPTDFSRPIAPAGVQNQNVGRFPAPQRPPRPNFVPAMSQPSQPEWSPRNHWEDESLDSSRSSRPLTTSTISTTSSTGSIPDFPSIPPMPPAPLFQPPPRRNLGPPPSARKGGSGYYPNSSFVPPIPEEMSDAHSSMASSQIIPESWADGPPGYYLGGGIDEEDEEDGQGGNSSGRGSSAGDHDDSSGLVRRGSYGNPRMAADGGDATAGEPLTQEDERWRTGPPGTDPIGRHNFRGLGRLNPSLLYSGYESDLSFLDSPREQSRSQSPMPQLNGPASPVVNAYFGSPRSAGSPVDPRVGEILGHLEKGGALPSSGTASPPSVASMSEKGFKRPPRLNLDESKEGPARSSATSLPDLIRRATKLASNLDRGKTASRVGMLDLLNAKEKEKERERQMAAKGDGSISDILAAFPSPSPTTPTAHRPAGWPTPSPHGRSALSRAQTPGYGSSVSHRQKSRKCCGLPVWAFILLIIILLLLIAAAVIIPITLVVLPRESKDKSPSLESCQSSQPCANGGSSIVVNAQCSCICSNGFIGASCDTAGDESCTSEDVPGVNASIIYHNATLGDSIPRIFSASAFNFSIPLRPYTVLSLFSTTNLSCASENALVTFEQKSQRRDLAQIRLPDPEPDPRSIPAAAEEIISTPTRTYNYISRILHARGSAQTTNGILVAGPAPGTSNAGSAPESTATSESSPTTNTNNQRPVTQGVLDFSRTAVLFVFQETSSLDQAMAAANKLQMTLGDGDTFDASQTSVGMNITINLSAFTVEFGNGTLYGGEGAS